MTPRSTFALALCAYILATGASLYTRRGGAEERSTPSGRVAAPYIWSETAAAGNPGRHAPGGQKRTPDTVRTWGMPKPGTGSPPVVVSHHPKVIRWLPQVRAALAQQEE